MKVFGLLLVIASVIALAQAYVKPAFLEDLRSRQDGRIIQGTPAFNGQFPHQAFLITRDSLGRGFACGGSLITTKWVLTAAHCLDQMQTGQVYLGHVSWAAAPVIVASNNLIMYPSYNPININHDIGLMELVNDVELTANIQTIPFARNPDVTFAGSDATVSGFGATSTGGSVSNVLNYVAATVITNAVCQETYGSQVIIPSTICIVGRDSLSQGVCSGDSGGPLIMPIDGVTTQIGVVSFGSSSGCETPHPQGFVRPTHYVSWIGSYTGL